MLRRLGRARAEVPDVQGGELLQLVVPAVPVPGGELAHVAVVVEQRDEHPVGQPRDAQRRQPVEQLGHVERGDQRAGRLGHERQPALGALGVGLRALGVGPRLLGDRPGELRLLPGGLLGGEGRLPLALDPDPLGDVGLHARRS